MSLVFATRSPQQLKAIGVWGVEATGGVLLSTLVPENSEQCLNLKFLNFGGGNLTAEGQIARLISLGPSNVSFLLLGRCFWVGKPRRFRVGIVIENHDEIISGIDSPSELGFIPHIFPWTPWAKGESRRRQGEEESPLVEVTLPWLEPRTQPKLPPFWEFFLGGAHCFGF